MPESAAAIAAYFGGTAEAVGAGAAVAEGAGSSALAIGAGTAETASVAELGLSSASLIDAGTIGGGGAFLGALGKTAATAAVTGGTQSLLAPKRPDLPKPLPMPDPQAQEEARRKAIIEQTSRRGRASTILTDAASGTLGG